MTDPVAKKIWLRASKEYLTELFEELEKAQIAQVCNYGLKTVLFEEKLQEIKQRYLSDNKNNASDKIGVHGNKSSGTE